MQSPPQHQSGFSFKGLLQQKLFKISASYVVIVVVGITSFYLAKRNIDVNRQHNMLVKQEIKNEQKKYPNRFDLINAEKEKLKKNNNS